MTAGMSPPAGLAAGILRLAADLPPSGPRGRDLTPVAAAIGESLGAARVVLRVFGAGELPDQSWSAPGRGARGDVRTITRPIRHRGAEVGALVLHLAGSAHHQPSRQLLDDATSVLGIVVAEAATDARLRATRRRNTETLERVADARHRAASEMESERHALERDLHDGAQLHLVSLQLAAAVLEHHLDTGTADAGVVTEAVADIGARLDRTHRLLMDTAAGIMPSSLRAAGLAPALASTLGEARHVTLDVDPEVRARRYPPIVESTVYLTCLEAVNNAQKHAPGAAVTVTVRNVYHGLWFAVADSGPGPGDAAIALPSLRARLASVGGTLRVTSLPGGTEIVGTVPI